MKDKIADRFLIYHKIGQGSFGAVFSGYDLELKQLVAIKVENNINSLSFSELYITINIVGHSRPPDQSDGQEWPCDAN